MKSDTPSFLLEEDFPSTLPTPDKDTTSTTSSTSNKKRREEVEERSRSPEETMVTSVRIKTHNLFALKERRVSISRLVDSLIEEYLEDTKPTAKDELVKQIRQLQEILSRYTAELAVLKSRLKDLEQSELKEKKRLEEEKVKAQIAERPMLDDEFLN